MIFARWFHLLLSVAKETPSKFMAYHYLRQVRIFDLFTSSDLASFHFLIASFLGNLPAIQFVTIGVLLSVYFLLWFAGWNFIIWPLFSCQSQGFPYQMRKEKSNMLCAFVSTCLSIISSHGYSEQNCAIDSAEYDSTYAYYSNIVRLPDWLCGYDKEQLVLLCGL